MDPCIPYYVYLPDLFIIDYVESVCLHFLSKKWDSPETDNDAICVSFLFPICRIPSLVSAQLMTSAGFNYKRAPYACV